MSASETPKKVYFKQGKQAASSSCRLCMKICDPKNAKNIFNRGNVELLATAEDLLEQTLERGENLPHLVCRPCERRLANFKQFKELARNTQRRIKADVPYNSSTFQEDGKCTWNKSSRFAVFAKRNGQGYRGKLP